MASRFGIVNLFWADRGAGVPVTMFDEQILYFQHLFLVQYPLIGRVRRRGGGDPQNFPQLVPHPPPPQLGIQSSCFFAICLKDSELATVRTWRVSRVHYR